MVPYMKIKQFILAKNLILILFMQIRVFIFSLFSYFKEVLKI